MSKYFGIKKRENLPKKWDLKDQSQWWIPKRTLNNVLEVLSFLDNKYAEDMIQSGKKKGYSLKNISKGSGVNEHSVSHVILLLLCKEGSPIISTKIDQTKLGKCRIKVFLEKPTSEIQDRIEKSRKQMNHDQGIGS